MPKNREKTRANKRKEQALNRLNAYGAKDLTPYKAVELIRKENTK